MIKHSTTPGYVGGLVTGHIEPNRPKTTLRLCASTRDGDCEHANCLQLRDGEPAKTGRHCPLDLNGGDDE